MEWVYDFYQKQQQWLQIYERAPGETEAMQVEDLKNVLGAPPARVLELGAGGGQFAKACAEAGYEVTPVELIPELARLIKEKKEDLMNDNLQVYQGDFYELELPGFFSAVCYWDGFGIGSDEDQQCLLKRINNWLETGGAALIDIYSPWHWARISGEKKDLKGFQRETFFDPENSRFLDTLRPRTNPEKSITQSLRCYSPADLKLLLRGTGLFLEDIEPRGGFNPEDGTFDPEAPLLHSIYYRALLKKLS